MSASAALNCDSIKADDFLLDDAMWSVCSRLFAMITLKLMQIVAMLLAAKIATCAHFTWFIHSPIRCKLLSSVRHRLQFHLKVARGHQHVIVVSSNAVYESAELMASWELMALSSPTSEFQWTATIKAWFIRCVVEAWAGMVRLKTFCMFHAWLL